MLKFIQHLLRRIGSQIVTFLIITAILYASVMLTPAETRATLYMPRNTSHMTEQQYQDMLNRVIERYHLNDPFPVQYFYWITNLAQGNWGYSPTLQTDVHSALMQRVPATTEIILYSILLYFPLGIISGAIAARRKDKAGDHVFRFTAYAATAVPPFILAIIMMAIFYIDLYWFAPERASSTINFFITSDQFKTYTGLLTIDGLLNRRPDITLDALRHLVMPVVTLSFANWAILGSLTRTSMVEELHKEYVIAARARGLSERRILWVHMLRNVISPAFSSSLVSAASLITGVMVVEIIFNYPGISYIALRSVEGIPDAPAALGFTLYCVILVLILMTILDMFQYGLDPRIREQV